MSTQNYKELLANTHPLFRVPATKVFWFDSVMNKESHQGIRQRYLAITSAGIFLFERRTFPKVYAINRIISYSDLVLICVDSDSMQFFKAKVTMNLQSSRHLEAAAMVLTIRNALFGDKPRAPKVIIDPSIKDQFEKYRFNFESDNLIADRFLSLCLSIEDKSLNPEQISDFYDCLKVSPNYAQISTEIANSPLVSAVSLAIAYDKKIQSLHLKNINFSSFVNNFIPIVQYNSSIQKLYLSSVIFSGKIQSYVDVWNDKTAFSANQYIFNDCNLTSTDFVTYFKTFKKYPADMQTLVFIQCTMNTLGLETIFSTISSSLCFRTLIELSFNNMKTDESLQTCFLQFATSNFFMVQKNLQCLSLEDIGIDIHIILPFLLHYPSCFTNLSLIGNNFLNPISITDFHRVIEMDLSSMHFTSDSLLSILNCMAKSENHPQRLILDSLSISDEDWQKFYSQISSIVIPKLVMISFCGNKMNSEYMHQFTQFLLNHPSISEIGISNSILYEDAEESINGLIQVVTSKPIKKLEIRGKNDTILRQKLIPLLRSLVEQATIKMLDITGQEISDQGLELIARAVLNQPIVETPQPDQQQQQQPDQEKSQQPEQEKSQQPDQEKSQQPEQEKSQQPDQEQSKSETETTKLNQNPPLMIEELRFDGNAPSSIDVFVKVITKFEQSSILASEWPECDTRFVLSKTTPNLRPNITKQVEGLKKQFFHRFALEDEITSSSRNKNRPKLTQKINPLQQSSKGQNDSSSSSSTSPASTPSLRQVRRRSSAARNLSFSSMKPFSRSSKRILNKRMKEESCLTRPPQFDLNILSFREDYVDNALAECLGNDLSEIAKLTDEEKQSKEPFVIALEKINNETSILAFLQKDL